MSEVIESSVRQRFPDAVVESGTSDGVLMLRIAPSSLVEVCHYLKESPDLAFDYPADITGIDWKDRFEVVYHLYSMKHRHKLVVKVDADHANPVLPSACEVWKGADWQEREIYDLLGIRFEGHPNLERILLPEDWEGYPLRKDYVIPD